MAERTFISIRNIQKNASKDIGKNVIGDKIFIKRCDPAHRIILGGFSHDNQTSESKSSSQMLQK